MNRFIIILGSLICFSTFISSSALRTGLGSRKSANFDTKSHFSNPLTDRFVIVSSSLIANSPNDTAFNLNEFLRVRLFNHSQILQNLVDRNITLDAQLLSDFHWYFDIRSPSVHSPKFQLSMNFKFDPDFKTSVNGSSQFCCSCYVNDLNCPVCSYEGVYYCEYPFRNYSESFYNWHYNVFVPSYNFVDISTSYVVPHTGSSYIYSRSEHYTFAVVKTLYASGCSPRMKNVGYLHGNYTVDCVKVVPYSAECHTGEGTIPPNNCDTTRARYTPIGDSEYKMCYSPFKTDLEYRHTDGKYKHFCNHNRVESYFKTLYHYITQNEKVWENRDNWRPRYVGRTGGTLHISVPDFSDFNDIVQRMQFESLTMPVYRLPRSDFERIPVVCDGSYTEISPFFNGKPSWIGDKLIHPECSRYVDYNGTHLICYDSLFLQGTMYCYSHLFVEKVPLVSDPLIYFVRDVDWSVGGNVSGETCQLLNNTAQCSFNSLFSEYFDRYNDTIRESMEGNWSRLNLVFVSFSKYFSQFVADFLNRLEKVLSQIKIDIYPALNRSLDNAVTNMLNAMGMNDKNLYFYEGKCLDQCKYGAVGNWLSGIFYSLIEPFFKAFIDLVVKSFFLPLLQGFTAVVVDLVDPLQELSDVLLKVISQLALSLTKIFVVVFKLVIGIIIFIESYLLLFEYTLLFLFLMKYVVTDFSFSLVVVLIFSVIFGIVRKSPSFLITFLNPDFMIFDLSHYYGREFDYNYTLAFVEGSILHVFSFGDLNKTSLSLY